MLTHKKLFNEVIEKFHGEYPTPVVAIAEKLGISVVEKDFDNTDFYGEISKDDDNKYTISINSKSDAPRIRNTVAHEIGHFVKHEDFFQEHNVISDVKLNFKKTGYDELELIQEDEANEFAIELLVPKKQAFKMLTEGKTIQEIAHTFIVPEATVILSIGWDVGLANWED
ncbi:MAG: ImmA/IrrE family metallo-endopeptidase [Gammaproteobacteria bacterium]|nr:ImmA/IrrE family metallo-endopeptidase [Gammaproteobacteria bacterium]